MSAQNPLRRGVLGAIVGTLAFSVLAGLLVTALVTPAIAVTGVAVNSSIGVFDDLPTFITIGKQAQQNRIFATKGTQKVQIATVYSENREEVTWDKVSQFAKDAAISGEDRRFFQHGGIDPAGIVRAAVKNIASHGVSQGASTISQQLVKNIFVSQANAIDDPVARRKAYDDATSVSLDRKLKEMKLAIALEKKYSKKDILLAYLNIANFGSGTYGIQAAALRYYSVPALKLDAAQAASLVAIVQNPDQRKLDNPSNYAANKQRRDVILNAMFADGKLTAAQHTQALKTPVDKTTVKLSTPKNGCMAADPYAKYWCDFVVKNVKNFESLGATAAEREANWRIGGYDLYTTLDMRVQKTAQLASWQYAPNDTPTLKLGSATSSIENGTGRVLVMAQNKLYNNTSKGGGNNSTAVNFNTDKAYGGSSGFQAGSTYKLFTLLDWLKQGRGLNEVVDGRARTVEQSSFPDSCETWGGPPYQFKNDTLNENHSWRVRDATASSVNGAFISMAQQLDLCDIRKTAQSMGVHTAKPFPHGGPKGPVSSVPESNPSSVLGTNYIAPLTMAAAYATVGSGGIYCAPIILDSVTDPEGKKLPGQKKDCHRALDANIAATASLALQEVISGPYGIGAASNPQDGVPIEGKTGTTDNSQSTWMDGGSTKVTTVVWVGNISGTYPIRYLYNGTSLRHYIWRATMAKVNPLYGGGPFPLPDPQLVYGNGIRIPSVAGMSIETATANLEGLGFSVIVGNPVDGAQPQGQIATSVPAAGALLSRGYSVTIHPSQANLGSIPDVAGRPFADAKGVLTGAGYANVVQTCVVVPKTDPTMHKVVSTLPVQGSAARLTDPVKVLVAEKRC